MYAITGITGQVGGAMARALLSVDKTVRAVVRNIEKGQSWAAKGCEIVVADMEDATALVFCRRPNSTRRPAIPRRFA